MKRSLLIPLVLAAVTASAQEKYLISPDQEVIPIEPGLSAASVIAARLNNLSFHKPAICSDQFYFGYPPEIFPPTSNFGSYHADVIGQWFTAKATGTIDTIFWNQWMAIGAHDSAVFLRVHKSLIGPGYGPGIRPGPFPPPCQNWGYWRNSNDLDQGIAAFIEDATDSNWVSTIGGTPIPSTPHIGEELWGSGGYAVRVKPATVNFVPMEVLGDTLGVTAGDRFFVSFRIPPCPDLPSICHDNWDSIPEVRTEWSASGFSVTTVDEDYPSHIWKFYEHDKGPSNCSGMPIDSVKRGWVARGGFSSDTLDVAVFNIWYSMTVRSNVAPIIEPPPIATTMFDTDSAAIGVTVTDCDPENPGNAGVQSVTLMHEIDGVAKPDIPMNYHGADYWETWYTPPPGPAKVIFKFKAVDLTGAVTISPSRSIFVVSPDRLWYGIDTTVPCDFIDISQTGTSIDTALFFNPDKGGVKDAADGIAGPIDLGTAFRLFGDTFRYAWIGVDGAIGLVKNPFDIVTFPAAAMQSNFLVAPGTIHPGIDRIILAPFWWAGFILGDTAGQFGNIRYGNGGDSCSFIVEWDSIGGPLPNNGVPDGVDFSVILDRCEGTVEFQYANTGGWGYDTVSIIGMESKDVSVTFNRMGYPVKTRPRNQSCVKFYPRNRVPGDGWHLVSVSVIPNDGNYSPSNLFPGGPVYRYVIYDPGPMDSVHPGYGYWMKNLQPGTDGAAGIFFDSISIPVVDKWNLIGGTSFERSATDLVPVSTAVVSPIWEYDPSGYHHTDVLRPGEGYWVKVAGTGTLEFHPSAAAPKVVSDNALQELQRLTTLTISDALERNQMLYVSKGSGSPDYLQKFELPPAPPGDAFDARFASGAMLEMFDEGKPTDTTGRSILIRGAVAPVSIRWEPSDVKSSGRGHALEITHDGGTTRYMMEKSGSTRIMNPERTLLRVVLEKTNDIPSDFYLSSNYPNPFNPVTRLDYSLQVSSRVKIVVFNIAGEEVATLIDVEKPAGNHTVRWDAADLPSGVYYCTMTAEGFRTMRKMLLLK